MTLAVPVADVEAEEVVVAIAGCLLAFDPYSNNKKNAIQIVTDWEAKHVAA